MVLTPLFLAVVIAATVLVVMLVVTAQSFEKAEVRESLRRLEGYQIQDVRDQEMLAPIQERIIAPLLGSLGGLTGRFTPQGYREQLARKLVIAGNPKGFTVDQLLIYKLLGLVSGIVWLPLVFLGLHLSGPVSILAVAFLWGGSFMLPDVYLSRHIEQRQHDIAVQLPDILDLLVISVEAG